MNTHVAFTRTQLYLSYWLAHCCDDGQKLNSRDDVPHRVVTLNDLNTRLQWLVYEHNISSTLNLLYYVYAYTADALDSGRFRLPPSAERRRAFSPPRRHIGVAQVHHCQQ